MPKLEEHSSKKSTYIAAYFEKPPSTVEKTTVSRNVATVTNVTANESLWDRRMYCRRYKCHNDKNELTPLANIYLLFIYSAVELHTSLTDGSSRTPRACSSWATSYRRRNSFSPSAASTPPPPKGLRDNSASAAQ